MMVRRFGLSCLSLPLFVVVPLGCSDDASTNESSGSETAGESGEAETGETGDDEFVDAEFTVRESVRQLHITHTEPGTELRVVDGTGTEVALGTSDALGSLIFRELVPGDGYSVEQTGPAPKQAARELTVMSVENSQPDQAFYDGQILEPGFNYITTRDGTTLSAYVTLPGPIEDGPYATIVNYSGYEPSRPGSSLAEQFNIEGLDLESLCPTFAVICDAPYDPSGILGGFMGYATVSVNMRGTGCSGGAYDFFEELQVLDGYDMIETVATQDWVLGNKVGMTGLSYPGISQMWVAKSNPPSLAAIAPMSIFAHTADSVLRPGGITNDGFALNWASNVLDNAVPYGQGWEQAVVDGGDAQCEENQLLHGQLVDLIAKANANPYYTAELYDPLNPLAFAGDIDVPIFVTGGWQDEQTGGDFMPLFDAFSGSPLLRFTAFNGIHRDGYTPEHLLQWGAFLDFYLREQIPELSTPLRNIGPTLFAALLGEPIEFGPDPYTMYATYEEALAAYEAEDPITIKFEMGNSADYSDGIPESAWELKFSQWPPAEVVPQRWYFQPDGSFAPTIPADAGGGSSFHVDSQDSRTRNVDDGSINDTIPNWNWRHDEPDTAVVFLSEALASDVVMVGPASADLWIRSSVGEADIEVNITEVRPDGQEMYVQSGWLRATRRALDEDRTTDLAPVHTHLEADLAPVPSDEWVLARLQIFPFAHGFRAGSQIRISVDTPGASRTEWLFVLDPTQTDDARIDVGHATATPSSILLPILPGQTIPTELPPCPSLRAQPCREYVPFSNSPAE